MSNEPVHPNLKPAPRKDILRMDDKGASLAGNNVARLWRLTLMTLRITPDKYNKLMDAYLTNAANGIPQNPRDISTEKGNLDKALLDERMTWASMEKGLRMLDLQKADFCLNVTTQTGHTYVVTLPIQTTAGGLTDEPPPEEQKGRRRQGPVERRVKDILAQYARLRKEQS